MYNISASGADKPLKDPETGTNTLRKTIFVNIHYDFNACNKNNQAKQCRNLQYMNAIQFVLVVVKKVVQEN